MHQLQRGDKGVDKLMAMKFKKGDIVGFLHEKGKGEVVKIIDDSHVTVITNDGFESAVSINDIYLMPRDQDFPPDGYRDRIKDLGFEKNKKNKKKQYSDDEVDLHIDSLADDISGLSNSDMIQIQLRHFRRTLEKAIDNGVKRIVFIHGAGKGVLKNEIITILKKFDNLKFRDAPYDSYGHGATEVLISG